VRAPIQFGHSTVLKTLPDVTGPSTAMNGILIIYDVFGYYPQILQGADILATFDEEHQYQVFVPDILDDTFANIDW
jgi:hypothetical protein